jgi:hypothetical protein
VELIIGDSKEPGKDGGREGENNDHDDEAEGENQEDSDKKRKKKKLIFTDKQGEKTLDKLENINMAHFDTEAMIDPLFK